MKSPLLEIVIASTRPGRVGLPVGDWVYERALLHGAFAVEIVDLALIDLPLLDEPNHPRLRQYVHQHTKDWSTTIERADAFVFVTPEYNHGFNAPLKNALDYLHAEWAYKPVGFVSYGGLAAGTRAVQMLKQVVTSLKMVPLMEAVNIPFINQLLDEQKRLRSNETIERAAAKMLDELGRWTSALEPLR
jgi:NAD(P)H-dependent FMN reductase